VKATRVGFVACVAALAAAAPAHATYGGRAGLVTFDSSAGHSDGSLSLFVQSPLEGGARELFADRESAYGRRPSDSDASWSRSGRRFVFARYGLVRSRIYVAHANGSHLREVPLPSNVHAEDPALGPDGKTVAYVQVAPGDPNDDLSRGEESVHVARLDGSHRRAIGAGAEPTWTPDGRILYSGPGAQCARLVLVRPNGTRRRAITSGKKVHGRC
jgi:Tol biopolymer transport system component